MTPSAYFFCPSSLKLGTTNLQDEVAFKKLYLSFRDAGNLLFGFSSFAQDESSIIICDFHGVHPVVIRLLVPIGLLTAWTAAVPTTTSAAAPLTTARASLTAVTSHCACWFTEPLQPCAVTSDAAPP